MNSRRVRLTSSGTLESAFGYPTVQTLKPGVGDEKVTENSRLRFAGCVLGGLMLRCISLFGADMTASSGKMAGPGLLQVTIVEADRTFHAEEPK